METFSGKGNLSSIKTAVFYKWNAYLPENISDLSTCHDIFLEDYSSTDVFYLSEDSGSDYLGFSEYDFKFKPEKDKYKSYVKTNYLDKETLSLAKNGEGNYDYETLRWLTEIIFPQGSSDSGDSEKKFFGVITKGSESIIYIDIPGEVRDEEDPEEIIKNGIWKVEFYTEILSTNNAFSPDKFIEYSVLESCGLGGIKEPCLTVTFGPPSNAAQNPRSGKNNMYYDSSRLGGKDPFYSSDNLTKITGWLNLCREISSRKILYLAFSSLGDLTSINLSYISWELSPNPNRNQNEYSLRNDYFWSSRDKVDSITTKGSDDFVYDGLSGVILATKKLYEGSTPSLDRRMRKLPGKFLSRKVYSESEIVPVNDELYVSLVSGNIGENPQYSKYWKKLGDYNEKVDFSDISGSQKKLKDLLTPDYIDYYIHVNDKTKIEKMNLSDLVSFRSDVPSKILEITPIPGCDIRRIYRNGDLSLELSFNSEKACYEYDLVSKDFTNPDNSGDLVDIYIEAEDTEAYLGIISPIIRKNDYLVNEDGSDFSELFDHVSEIKGGYKIKFFLDDYKNPAKELSESMNPGCNRKFFIKDYNYKKAYLSISFEDSPYEVLSISEKLVTGELVKLDLIDSNDDPDLSVFTKVAEVISDGPVRISKDFEVVMTTKMIDVSVVSYDLMDISTVGEYINHGGTFSFRFSPSSDHYKFKFIQWTFEEEETRKLDTIGSFEENGIETARLINNRGIYTLYLYNVKKNCKIEIFGDYDNI